MIRARIATAFVRRAAFLALGLVTVACSTSNTASAPGSSNQTSGQPPKLELWGEMKPVVSVKELMRDMLDPIADNIFDAVSIIVTREKTVETVPKTEADWERIRIGGVTMAEGAYLLKVPRPFTPAGEENNISGPDAVELSAAQILDKVKKDPVEWNARIEALRNVGLEVMDIVKRKDVQELWDASENLEAACENCHRSYWYPGETLDFYRRLDRRLEDISTKTRRVGPRTQ